MEKTPIKDHNVIIYPNCPQELLEPIYSYWELNKEFEKIFKITDIKEKFDLDIQGINKLKQYSELECIVYCETCQSDKKRYVNSQEKFKNLLRTLKETTFKCNDCQTEEQNKKEREEQERREREQIELSRKQGLAIEKKAWRNLSRFEFYVLKNSLEIDDFLELKRFYWYKSGTGSEYKKFFMALENIAGQDLLNLEHNFDLDAALNRIVDFSYSPELKEKFEYNFIPKSEQEREGESQNLSTESSQLKLKLLHNSITNNPDAPQFGGTITFDKKIVIEPNVKYLFAQWERSNGERFFNLIPIDEATNYPKSRSLNSEPEEIKDIFKRFFNGMGDIN